MCEIGKPVEFMDVEPLSLPAPLRKQEQEQPTEEPVTVEGSVSEAPEVPVGATVSPIPNHEGSRSPIPGTGRTAFPLTC